MSSTKDQNRIRRQIRTRSKIKGTAARPRLSVFRSNRYLSAQLIDDDAGTTLAAVSSRSAKGEAAKVGEELAKLAKAKKIEAVVFDRGGYRFMGKVKQLADGARKGGLKF
ncbi:MAG: 50S ribosomal protein L18 [Candidatus Vogelbacteria bacterium GWA1_51_14]|uniref:Large ribosomal subunit protein uL18 n=1 Tax=Candidatus Vogelbacteria bacterium GWA1_51_14 TaxID=1802435 RepID=A0A1G2QA40_9BACT|nr:MAG: 50S ribosomal protein L18 [Candidatus Vogelbacteria bacterium GWA1_51_14]